jgi:anti-sigma factor RsiW
MDCKEFRELLDLYVDGELSPEANLSAHAHLDGCTACSRVQQQLAVLRRAVKRVVNQHEPPPELVHNVQGLIRPARGRLIPRPWARQHAMMDGAGTRIPFWQKKVAVPVPAFAPLLIAVLVTAGWIISMRPGSPSRPAVPIGGRKAASMSSAPVKGFDLRQFDRGERATIYKVRVTGQMDQKP